MRQQIDSVGSLSWESQIRNSFAGQLKVLLVASDTKDHGAGKCSIEVWAEDHGEELAYCRGIVCPRDELAIVLWLGRSDTRNVHPRVRGRRCVPNAQAPDGMKYTVAEAVFGVVIAISSLFGVSIVELQAKDNGSGRLVDLYHKLGFVKRPQNPGEIAWMEAPVAEVARIAPAEWVSGLVPEDFIATDWLRTAVMNQRFRRSCQFLFSNPPKHAVAWPMGSRIETKITPAGSFNVGAITSVVLEASLVDGYDDTLAWAKANVHFDKQFCRILWLGRQQGQPVHKKVRGRRMYSSHSSASEATEHVAGEMVSAAIGLVGVVASLALWLGAKLMCLQALDDGSGKLVAYFHGFGFGAVEGSVKDDQPVLTAPCDTVVQRCCPEEWLSELPAGTWVNGVPEPGKSRQATVKTKSSSADGPSAPRADSAPATQKTSDNGDGISGMASSRLLQLPQPIQSRASTPVDENASPMTPSGKEKHRLARPESTSPFIKAIRQKNSLHHVVALEDSPDHVTRPNSAAEVRSSRHDFVTKFGSRRSDLVTNFGSQRLTFLDDVRKDRARNDRSDAGDPLGPLKELVRRRRNS